MSKSNYQRILYAAVTDNKINADETCQLCHELELAIPVGQIEQLITHNNPDKHKILLFNYYDRKSIAPFISSTCAMWDRVETIVFNVPHRIPTEKLLELGNLKGLFYETDDMDKLRFGLNAIINGQNWLPRHVTSQLIYFYRHQFRQQTLRATIDLTRREIQILKSLQTGASNLQMAERLFISEFTVKSHLHQIFKKISVKNRSQAINWAEHNIVS